MDFLTFRSGALQGLSMVKNKSTKFSKTDIEAHIKAEYNRHYPMK